jgi:hypothetical protein
MSVLLDHGLLAPGGLDVVRGNITNRYRFLHSHFHEAF